MRYALCNNARNCVILAPFLYTIKMISGKLFDLCGFSLNMRALGGFILNLPFNSKWLCSLWGNKNQLSCSVVSDSLRPEGLQHTRLPYHQLWQLTQTHVRWFHDAIHHLILCCPLLLLSSVPPRIKVFSNESVLHNSQLFPQLFVRTPQTIILPFAFIILGMILVTASCTVSWTSVHSSSNTLSDLIPWIILSFPLYTCNGFD